MKLHLGTQLKNIYRNTKVIHDQGTTESKTAEMAIISSNVYFSAKNILRDKESHLTTKNGSVHHHSGFIYSSIRVK